MEWQKTIHLQILAGMIHIVYCVSNNVIVCLRSSEHNVLLGMQTNLLRKVSSAREST